MLFLLLCSTRFDNISRNQRVGTMSEQNASYRFVRKRKKHLYLRRNANKTMVGGEPCQRARHRQPVSD